MKEPDEVGVQRGIFYSQIMKVSSALIMFFRGFFGIGYHLVLAIIDGIKLFGMEVRRRS
jgi:hypothetical protein